MPSHPPHPQGSTRLAIQVDGTESDAEMMAIKALNPAVVLLNTAQGTSRIHASRRVFELLNRCEVTTPVVHYIKFGASAVK